jgi:type IV pilus assembly protein PilB
VGRALLGQMLKQAGLVSEDQLTNALIHQRKWGCRIGEALLDLRVVAEDDVLRYTARQLGLRAVRIGDRNIKPAILRFLPHRVIDRHRVLPLELVPYLDRRRLVVAFPRPDDLKVVDEVTFASGLEVEPVLAAPADINRAISRHYGHLRSDALEVPADDGPMMLVDGRVV